MLLSLTTLASFGNQRPIAINTSSHLQQLQYDLGVIEKREFVSAVAFW